MADQLDELWSRNFDAFCAWFSEHGEPNARSLDDEEHRLAWWRANQRRQATRGTLSPDRLLLLDREPWFRPPDAPDESAHEVRWRENFDAFCAWFDEHGHPAHDSRGEERRLFSWRSNQRARAARGDMAADRLRLLEAQPWWPPIHGESRGARGEVWARHLDEVSEHFATHGVTPPQGAPGGRWLSHQVHQARRGKIRPDRLAILEEQPWWEWRLRGARVVAPSDGDAKTTTAAIPVRPDRVLPPESEWLTDEKIMCLECGEWFQALGKHLPRHDLDAASYRALWGMTQRHPLASRDLSAVRRKIAIESGGPDRLRAWVPIVSDQAHEAARKREVRPQERSKLVAGSRKGVEARAAVSQERLDRADEIIAEQGFGSRREWLAATYWDGGRTQVECARILDVPLDTIKEWMEVEGIRSRRTGPRAMKRR